MVDLFKTAEAIRKQAAISSRPGQLDALEGIADEVEAGARELITAQARIADCGRHIEAQLTEIGDKGEAITVLRERVRGVRDEVDSLRALRDRVTALADQGDAASPDTWGVHYVYVSQLRAAIEGQERGDG